MQSLTIQGKERTEISKSAVKALRNDGLVPCVLYGEGEPIHFSAKELDFNKLLFTPNTYFVDLDIDGKNYRAVMKEKQFHPVTDKLLHVDFIELNDNKVISLSIPVKLNGTAEGVKQGGRLINKLRKVNIKALPKNIPDYVDINIDRLNIGDSIRVKDVSIDGVTLTDQPSNVIVGVRTMRKVEVVAADVVAPAEGEAPATEEKEEEEAK